ncbi:O-antigen ligase family protein [Hyphomicrobium sp.]|uniref:O-antigen ligase family protein n=1 Tax=Hyphomicrobium sp. TaxID=82 RepID=UPI002D7773C4|nr:O-antigen ligase family protein [Hyphomicrobium sp.]HET6389287.1 O-antigen ligase family protein [Hyphomicrobium sp.]
MKARRPHRWSSQRARLRAVISKNALLWLTGVVLAASIAFGGATRNGLPGDVFLQFLSVILLVGALRKVALSGSLWQFRWPLIFIAGLTIIPAVQLLPLPPELWSRLPGRTPISQTYALLGDPLPALPLSMTPSATWLSGLALLPPVAVFLGTLSLGYVDRRRLSYVLIAMALFSVLVGLLQLAQGPSSGLRFYEDTNKTEAVGFFANRNHFAALLYATSLFVAAHLVDAIGASGQTGRRRRLRAAHFVPLLMWLSALFALTAAQMMARSRAGLVLGDLALAAGIVIGFSDPRVSRRGWARMSAGFIAAVVLLLLPLAIYRISDRFGADPFSDLRIDFARKTASSAYAYMPFGTGLGSFVPVFQLHETNADLGLTYANHAHNDFLEVWLETGIFGLCASLLFGIWMVRRVISAWRRPRDHLHSIDVVLTRAAAIVVLLLLLHSLVDYPLRTTAMMTVAAFALALLVRPAQLQENEHRDHAVALKPGRSHEPRPAERPGDPRALDAKRRLASELASAKRNATAIRD